MFNTYIYLLVREFIQDKYKNNSELMKNTMDEIMKKISRLMFENGDDLE